MPDLHVVAAGSLLEFALEELPSYGVGRIRSLFMYPMSFDEYLNAMNLSALANKISVSSIEKPMSEPLHKQCLNQLVRFIAIGGMFVGLEIVKNLPCNTPAQLFYWQREQRGSQAEIDYLIEEGTKIVPVEVKAGTRGAMQSLHQFMAEKNVKKGVRVSLENFGKVGDVEIYPIYASSKIFRTIILEISHFCKKNSLT